MELENKYKYKYKMSLGLINCTVIILPSGLNSSIASGTGVLNENFHGSLLSLSTSVSGGDTRTTASSGSSHRSSHPQRRALLPTASG